MVRYGEDLNRIADVILVNSGVKPNYSITDFVNILLIFQSAIHDKMWDMQESENMEMCDRVNMSGALGLALKKLIHTYTGIDTHKIIDEI